MSANAICPHCGSAKTQSGKQLLNSDIAVATIGGILTLGIATIMELILMPVRALSGRYTPHLWTCQNCNNRWEESD